MLLKASCCLTAMLALSVQAAERPRIVAIANIAVKVDNLDEARKFYSGVVGMAEAFQTKDAAVAGDLACFKVNDRQYVEVSPTLKGETEDRLIRIGFETDDARGLRDYLAGKGVKVPPEVDKDPNGNRSFEVKDPDTAAISASTCPASAFRITCSTWAFAWWIPQRLTPFTKTSLDSACSGKADAPMVPPSGFR